MDQNPSKEMSANIGVDKTRLKIAGIKIFL